MQKPTYRISCKAALYNPSKTKVLVVEYLHEYSRKDFGLPGGHLEDGESPDQAIIREIKEEIGFTVSINDLTRIDFWPHRDGKIILGYAGAIDESTVIKADQKEVRQVIWAPINDIRQGLIDLRDYTTS